MLYPQKKFGALEDHELCAVQSAERGEAAPGPPTNVENIPHGDVDHDTEFVLKIKAGLWEKGNGIRISRTYKSFRVKQKKLPEVME